MDSNRHARLWPLLLLIATFPLHAGASESWRCEIDLHQGDRGTLEIARAGEAIEGTAVIQRGDRTMEHEITGEWDGESIRFQRRLSATSGQPFRGVAVPDEGRVMMGGRFAAGHQGVWSAECSRSGPGPAENERLQAGPVSTLVLNPTAAAALAEAVRQPSRGSGWTDDPGGGPVPTCSISGQLKGDTQLRRFFYPLLFGPDDRTGRPPRSAASYVDGRYRFEELPDGQYWIRWETRADSARSPKPAERSLRCRGQAITGIDFDL